MGNIRAELSGKNKYYLSKHAFYMVYHYAMQYPDWKQEYDSLSDSLKGADGMPGKNSMPGKPTENTGIKRAELKTKMELVEITAQETDKDLAEYILLGVISGNSYNYLKMVHNIPCGRNQFYNLRRKFYYLLSKKI